MKTTSNKKRITNSAYLLFFALFLTSQSGFAQANKVQYWESKYKGHRKGLYVAWDGHFNANLFVKEDISILPGEGKGIKFWKSDQYKINMGNSYKHHYGPVTDYSIKNSMNNTEGRGWVWGIYNSSPIMALSNRGHMQIAKTLAIGGNLVPNTVLSVDGRTYISENGGSEKGFGAGFASNDNYKDYLLWVEEGIVSADFAIAEVSDWPDYVFKESYKLSSIEEIEQHILEEGHLPNFPSAEEVETMGYSLDDMTKRLLKTVEEMTLHTIQQEKKIDTQNSMMQQLVNRLEALENK